MARSLASHASKSSSSEALALEQVEPLIREIRGEKVILDSDLARLYGVTTKRLNEQVKRNLQRVMDLIDPPSLPPSPAKPKIRFKP